LKFSDVPVALARESVVVLASLLGYNAALAACHGHGTMLSNGKDVKLVANVAFASGLPIVSQMRYWIPKTVWSLKTGVVELPQPLSLALVDPIPLGTFLSRLSALEHPVLTSLLPPSASLSL
jgi:hypothetical protein